MKAYMGSRSTARLSKYWPDFKNGTFNTNNTLRGRDIVMQLIFDCKILQFLSLPTGINQLQPSDSTNIHKTCEIVFLLNNQSDALVIQIYSVIKLYMFRASSLPNISFLLYIRHW